jgi:type VI protein secretion system component VasF
MGMDGDNRFMGIRYALVCWLDELFIVDSPAWGADLANLWSARWNAAPLETALYGGAPERAWRFWRQADRAEAIHNDALEAYFLAAMLGFRGDYRFNLGALNTWVARVQDRVARHNNQDYQLPAEQQVPRRSWPLRAREGFQTMVQVLTLAVLVWISILAFAGVYSLR